MKKWYLVALVLTMAALVPVYGGQSIARGKPARPIPVALADSHIPTGFLPAPEAATITENNVTVSFGNPVADGIVVICENRGPATALTLVVRGERNAEQSPMARMYIPPETTGTSRLDCNISAGERREITVRYREIGYDPQARRAASEYAVVVSGGGATMRRLLTL